MSLYLPLPTQLPVQGYMPAMCPEGYEENKSIDAKLWECIHISECFEQAPEFVHNQFNFLPLTYSKLTGTPVVTTIMSFTMAASGTKKAVEIARLAGRHLVIAGIIQDGDSFEGCVKAYLKEGEIEYIGSIGPGKRNKLLGNAAALLHPVNFDEPFGLSVIEAMACGTPVIAFSRGSMPELIADTANGFLVHNAAEAVEKVKETGSISCMTCRKTIEERFTKERMAEEYIRVYKQILGI